MLMSLAMMSVFVYFVSSLLTLENGEKSLRPIYGDKIENTEPILAFHCS